MKKKWSKAHTIHKQHAIINTQFCVLLQRVVVKDFNKMLTKRNLKKCIVCAKVIIEFRI